MNALLKGIGKDCTEEEATAGRETVLNSLLRRTHSGPTTLEISLSWHHTQHCAGPFAVIPGAPMPQKARPGAANAAGNKAPEAGHKEAAGKCSSKLLSQDLYAGTDHHWTQILQL